MNKHRKLIRIGVEIFMPPQPRFDDGRGDGDEDAARFQWEPWDETVLITVLSSVIDRWAKQIT